MARKTKLKFTAHRGFTLIELLVVIAIIGILSTVVMGALNQARASARDAKRIENFRQLQIALQLYADANGKYPSPSGATPPETAWYRLFEPGTPGCNDSFGVAYLGNPTIGLVPNYISTIPKDPLGRCGLYRSMKYGAGYFMVVQPESDRWKGKEEECNPPPDTYYCMGVNWQ